jgi:hypothetical protein
MSQAGVVKSLGDMNEKTPTLWETFLNPEALRPNLIAASAYSLLSSF